MEENLNPRRETAAEGLARLSFGKINDAVRLLTKAGELDGDSISRLDLFGVSEIRQNKDGGLDIKFFDRLKALELLLASEARGDAPAASSFFGALESAAKSACDNDAV